MIFSGITDGIPTIDLKLVSIDVPGGEKLSTNRPLIERKQKEAAKRRKRQDRKAYITLINDWYECTDSV